MREHPIWKRGSTKGTGLLATLAVGLCLISAVALGASPGSEAGERTGDRQTLLPDATAVRWTGDLDGMIKRRMVRVLVPYSRTNYFVDRGTQRGLTYELFRLFEEELNRKLKRKHVRVHVLCVPVSRVELMNALLEGRGDIAASNLTITQERLKRVDFSDPGVRKVSEIVVTAPGVGPIRGVEDLSGKEVFVHETTSYHESLRNLNADLAREGQPPVRIRPAPENIEIEDILEMVNAGLVKITIVDDNLAEFWKKVLPNIVLHPEATVRTEGEIGFMIRKNCPLLKKELNAFLARHPEGSLTRNQLFQKYLKSTKFVKDATSDEEMAKFTRTVDFFRKYGDQYDLDYLLMMAQGYQESRLDHNAKSPMGALGVMQVMPATGKEMGVGDITEIEPNIHAGVKYIRFMVDQFYENEPMGRVDKGLFAFAAYNAGPGRISQLRRLAAKRGLDPNVWFNNVEVIASEKIGRETVTYVANIYKYYIAYRLVTEGMEARRNEREDFQKN